MRARWPVLGILIVFGAGYLGYPYVTLYRLGIAVRTADATTLRSLVDWHAVREGLKEDICDMVLEEPPAARASNALAPFGAGFVRGMTGNALDQRVTPETLSSLTRAAADPPGTGARVEWAFFSTPMQFLVSVHASGSAEPIRVAMELRDMRWRVRRVWLPNELLERVGSGT